MASCNLTLITGERFEVEGSREEVERQIIGAARGSILELAWFTEAETGQPLGVNPGHIVARRPAQAGLPALAAQRRRPRARDPERSNSACSESAFSERDRAIRDMSFAWSGRTNVVPVPVRPARPVRPTRCT